MVQVRPAAIDRRRKGGPGFIVAGMVVCKGVLTKDTGVGVLNRTATWSRLTQGDVFDLLVIGGGATGLGVALDASLRGYSVALLESHDFASGTSSRSTKLLHGGVRYLAQGNWSLVREALAERATLLRLAPHLAQPLAFVMPARRWWELPFYGAGLLLYDLLASHARQAGLGRTEWLSRQETLAQLPGLNPAGLWGGVKYWDAQFDDARLAVALACTADRAGAVLLNHCAVEGFLWESPSTGVAAVRGVAMRDAISGQMGEVRARCVVNATGVWVDGVRAMAMPEGAAMQPQQALVSPSQGVHLVVDQALLPADSALLVPRTSDGRVLFAVPWLGKLILGTTDTPRTDAPREPLPLAHEVEFILSEASRVLVRPVTRADVRSVWVGLRPLVRAATHQGSGGTRQLSREHIVVHEPGGWVTVTGGKWTTYRAMAEDVLLRCVSWGLLPPRPEPLAGRRSEDHLLVGGDIPAGVGGNAPQALTQSPGARLYGSQINELQALPGSQHFLAPGLSDAMIRWAARKEWAVTVEDVLARRSRCLFLDAALAASIAPEVSEILQQEHGMDAGLMAFLSLCEQYQLRPA